MLGLSTSLQNHKQPPPAPEPAQPGTCSHGPFPPCTARGPGACPAPPATAPARQQGGPQRYRPRPRQRPSGGGGRGEGEGKVEAQPRVAAGRAMPAAARRQEQAAAMSRRPPLLASRTASGLRARSGAARRRCRRVRRRLRRRVPRAARRGSRPPPRPCAGRPAGARGGAGGEASESPWKKPGHNRPRGERAAWPFKGAPRRGHVRQDRARPPPRPPSSGACAAGPGAALRGGKGAGAISRRRWFFSLTAFRARAALTSRSLWDPLRCSRASSSGALGSP